MRSPMHRVLVLGAGKIGSLVACLLSENGDYEVTLGDISLDASKRFVRELGLSRVTPLLLDVRHPDIISAHLTVHRFDAVLSSLPYFCNPIVAGLARASACEDRWSWWRRPRYRRHRGPGGPCRYRKAGVRKFDSRRGARLEKACAT